MSTEKQNTDGYIAALSNQLGHQPGNTDVDNLITSAIAGLHECSQPADPETASSLLEQLTDFNHEKALPLVKVLLKKVICLNRSGLKLVFQNWPEAATDYNAGFQYSDNLWDQLNELISENTGQISKSIRNYIREKSGYYRWNICCRSWD